jgi:hypothetical protein
MPGESLEELRGTEKVTISKFDNKIKKLYNKIKTKIYGGIQRKGGSRKTS